MKYFTFRISHLVLIVLVLGTLSCSKQIEPAQLSADELLVKEITAKLNQDRSPMNKLSMNAKEQFIKGLVVEEGELMSFGNEGLMRKELSYKERVDLYEILLDRGVILYGEGQEILAKGTLAEKSELMNGGHDPISAHSDYQWFGSATQCCKCYNSTCIGTKRNCQC